MPTNPPILVPGQIAADTNLAASAPWHVEESMKRSAPTKRPASRTTTRAARPRGASAGNTKASPDASAPAPAGPEKLACEATGSAADFVPPKRELPVLREAAKGCHGCTLYCNATQTVFGDGPTDAAVMFVGEQPGDQEDRAGRPFVGPSGQLLDEALREAGVPRDECYVTNAVKHFKFEPRGKRRIHSKPSAREVAACRPWLEAEIQVVRPTMIVCLGATAAQSLLGRDFRVTQHRGEVLKSDWAPAMLATVHPSSLLRVPDPEMRREARRQFVEDMKVVARQIRKGAR
jgi:uracil-DNA glycosylase